MNGPEHYAEAERLLARVDMNTNYGDKARALVEEAQVHAALAHAAAVVDTSRSVRNEDVAIAWGQALS